MTRGFAPVLRSNGGGAILNVISAVSWFTAPTAGAYAASKAAAWSLTDSTRLELTAQGTHVVAVHMGLVDTDMANGVEAPKIAPSELANAGLDAIESGAQEMLADDWTRFVKSRADARYEGAIRADLRRPGWGLDLRVGGGEVSVGRDPRGTSHEFRSRFHDVVDGQRLVFAYDLLLDGRLVSVSPTTVELRPDGDGTRLVFTEHGAFLDDLEDPVEREHGTGLLLDGLVAFLAGQGAA